MFNILADAMMTATGQTPHNRLPDRFVDPLGIHGPASHPADRSGRRTPGANR